MFGLYRRFALAQLSSQLVREEDRGARWTLPPFVWPARRLDLFHVFEEAPPTFLPIAKASSVEHSGVDVFQLTLVGY